MTQPTDVPAVPAGMIYDIGYHSYDGPRLGRRHAVGALIGHGLRTIFGIGRGERAKVAPVVLVGLALIPAIIQSWLHAASQGAASMVAYHTYFHQIEMVFLLFCAAQAPELVSTDQQHRVLPLYLSRPLRRADYVAGKLGALVIALACIALLGQTILLAGRIFGLEDVLAGVRAERGELVPIVAASLLAALLMSSISLAIAAHMKARTLASVAIVAFFLIMAALGPLLSQALPDGAARYMILTNPVQTLSGAAHWLFDVEPVGRTLLARSDLAGRTFGIAGAAWTVLATAVLFLRYARIRA
jgi:ABC-2 type transport system permease protein